jgi:intracellular septation protein
MGQQITLPDPVWRILNHAWAGFFAALGIANLYVAFNFATDTWVNFKLFGTTGLMLTFVIAQSLFIAKYMKEPEQCSMSSSNDASNNQEKP